MVEVEEQGATVAGDASLLIVDDEANLRNQLAKAMERRGFETNVAESVAEGLRAVTAHPPKYAVIDLRLGDGSGLEVVEALREARADARIVMLTGLRQHRHRRGCGEGGRRGLSAETRRRGPGGCGTAGGRRIPAAAAGPADVR